MQAADELLNRNQPLGPKSVPVAASTEQDLYSSPGPFKWPEHIPVRSDTRTEDISGSEQPAFAKATAGA
jgi:hypothetical protein